jgi:DNA-binding HxlR family transcriptional regulator
VLFQGKWTPAILFALRSQSRRLTEIRRLVPQISKKVLLDVLARLMKNGLIDRRNLTGETRHVEYKLNEQRGKLAIEFLESVERLSAQVTSPRSTRNDDH